MNLCSQRAVSGVLILLLTAGLGAVAYQHNAISQLRSEQQALSGETQEAGQLAGQNEGIVKLREENVEVVKLREENRDLPRLRNQARQLRREMDELTKLRAENERLQADLSTSRQTGGSIAIPPGFVSRSALRDAGTGTPEATAETFFWAACNGNIQRLSELTVDGMTAPTPDTERKEIIEAMKNFPGFSIDERKVISADEVQLNLQSSLGGPGMPMKLRKVGNDWKMEGH
jgi:hypothetical protein